MMKQLIVRLDGSVEIPSLLSVIDLEAPSPVQLRPMSFEFSRHRMCHDMHYEDVSAYRNECQRALLVNRFVGPLESSL